MLAYVLAVYFVGQRHALREAGGGSDDAARSRS
jgi:hypothetical protein